MKNQNERPDNKVLNFSHRREKTLDSSRYQQPNIDILKLKLKTTLFLIQCNPDIRAPDTRETRTQE